MVFKMHTFSLRGDDEDLLAIGGQIRRYSMHELKRATNNFSNRNIIGMGGYGNVYKGRLPEDGSLVAVKRLLLHGGQSVKEFQAEMLFASMTWEHPNLLRLRGYCTTKKEHLLVYAFMANGSLDHRLFVSDQSRPLDWPTRKRVALGVAKALTYMHQADSHFVHLDVKPSNILLDHDFEPILGDFGLSRTVGQSNSNWENQYPFVIQETEEDSEEASIPDHTPAGGGGGLTKCWNMTKTMVKSDSSSIVEVEVEAVREEARTCTWSCWQCTTTTSRNGDEVESCSQSSRGINEGQGRQEEEQFKYTTCDQTCRVVGTYGYMPPEYAMEGIYSPKNDVYGYGITLLQLISGQRITRRDEGYDTKDISKLFDSQQAKCCYKKLRDKQLHSFVDPRLNWEVGTEMEVEQLIRVALLCVQITPQDRPKMSQVLQMLQGDPFAFDPAGIFAFQPPHLIYEPEAFTRIENGGVKTNLFWFDEVELGAMMDSPRLDLDGSLSSEFDQTNEAQLNLNPKKDSSISSKGKHVASFSKAQRAKSRSQHKGIAISDNVLETFLSEVVSGVLPTKSTLCQSGMSVDPSCPMCNEYEEDSFHLFFNCDFSRQAWILAVGVRIDMFGFGSVKEAVDVILKPNGAGLNILPWDVEPSSFSHKGVALMHSIWTHRNQVFSDNVSPNVIQMLKDLPGATHLYGFQPPPPATQLIQESETATQLEFEAGSDADESSHQILAHYVDCKPSQECDIVGSDLAEDVQCESSQEIELAQFEPEEKLIPQFIANCVYCEEVEQAQLQPEVLFPEVLANCVMYESSQEIELTKPQPEKVVSKEVALTQRQPEQGLLPKVLEPGINSNQKLYLQVNFITSSGLLFSLKCNKPSVSSVFLVASLCMNLVFVWLWAK